jgi:coproporphyrinogen III oxidase-like Fe-S oxidoreductase
MYALPAQDLAALERDLDAATVLRAAAPVDLPPDAGANTAFALRPPVLPDDDLASDMLDLIGERTADAGLQRYEVSAFARPGHRCAHNLNYWQFGDYLGIGAGAHGKLSFPHRVVRQVRWREPAPTWPRRWRGVRCPTNTRWPGRPAVRVHAQCAAPARRLRAAGLP